MIILLCLLDVSADMRYYSPSHSFNYALLRILMTGEKDEVSGRMFFLGEEQE